MNIKPLALILPFSTLPTLIFMTSIILFMNACDSGTKSSKKTFFTQQKVQKFSHETTLKGIVSNKQGVLNSGEIKVTNNKGKLVATTVLQNSRQYSVTIPAGTELPLILSFYPDTKSKNTDKLISVAISKAIKKYDINDLTTVIAKKAKALGGYTHSNMVLAADSTVGVPDANKTTSGFRGDPTKQYGGWH